MRRSFVLGTAICSALAFFRASGQQAKRLPRVALVYLISPLADMVGVEPANGLAREFMHALRDVGLVEGRDIILERWSAEGQLERLAPIMKKVVASNVDVIVTAGAGVPAALSATDRIPIVGLVDGALDSGLVASLARPGRNLTGYGVNSTEFVGKVLQLLKEAAPNISRVAVIASAQPPGPRAAWRVEIDSAARSMQLEVLWLAVDSPGEFEQAFAKMTREQADSLYLANTVLNLYHLRLVADFAAKQRLPSVCAWREFAASGGLLSYGDDTAESHRHAAAYVKKIIDGAKPADLPFGQPTRFELSINLKTAKSIGLAISQTLLMRADKVIQ